jgi:hypothetical protein
MNILFLTFYGFRDFIDEIKDSFVKKGHTIYNISYLELKNDNIDDNKIIELINENIEKNKIDFMFYFLLPNNEEFTKKIKVKSLFYNFDDPISNNIDLIKYSKNIDYILTPLRSTKNKLEYILNSKIYVLPKYYNEKTIDNIDETNENKKENSISIIYDLDADIIYDNDKIIRELKILCLEKNYELNLFGDEKLKDIYPDIYDGEINMNEIKKSKLVFYMKDNQYGIKNDTLLDLLNNKLIVMTYEGIQLDLCIKENLNILFYNDKYIEKTKNVMENFKNYKLISENAKSTIKNNYSIDIFCKKIIDIINQ